MRLLADENFPGPAVRALRTLSHDVVWIAEVAPREPDVDVLARASREGRTVVTLDKDFGELAFHARLPAACGVVLFRLRRPWPTLVAAVATAVLPCDADFAGRFVVVEDARVRDRPLP